jgi:ligand-binding SRPBCC domain-containing protein
MSKIYKLHREQLVKTDIDTAWNFIRSPKNLERLTPDDLSFEIITDLPEEMYDGLLIEFRVGIPLLGKQTWLSEIKNIRKAHSFVDEQRAGPYKLWHHYHGIQVENEGVRFIDKVHYMLPFGPLGTIAHALYVRKTLQYVFDYRETMIPKLLENT